MILQKLTEMQEVYGKVPKKCPGKDTDMHIQDSNRIN